MIFDEITRFDGVAVSTLTGINSDFEIPALLRSVRTPGRAPKKENEPCF